MVTRQKLITAFSASALLIAAIGLYLATRSALFLVQVVEISDHPEQAPLDAQEITQLAAVPIGKVNLFDLDLKMIEQRILGSPWIGRVNLQKRFPQTLSISVVFREPRALVQQQGGALAYADAEGRVFGKANLLLHSDLPILLGFPKERDQLILEALKLVREWTASSFNELAQLSSISWDSEKGYRLTVSYPVSDRGAKARAMIDLGQEIDDETTSQLSRLSVVLNYLKSNSIRANQIWADSGKKIVVKTAHGS